MFKKLKENKKKGFTLVELIVVLVILAILAALLIPALTGYINKAKNKSIVAETRQVVMAAQTLVEEKYGVLSSEAADSAITVGESDSVASDKKTATIAKGSITDLAEVKGTIVGVSVKAGVVEQVVYQTNGRYCKYTKDGVDGTDGAYNVTTNAQEITTD